MGFIIMCSFVTLIALVGGGYYFIQDKKAEKRHADK